MLTKSYLKVQNINIVSYKTVYMQQKGKYASKEENTEDKERIKEKRRLITGIFRSHGKNHQFKCVFSAYFKLAGMIH